MSAHNASRASPRGPTTYREEHKMFYIDDLKLRHWRGEHTIAHPDCVGCLRRAQRQANEDVLRAFFGQAPCQPDEHVYLTPAGAAVARAL